MTLTPAFWAWRSTPAPEAASIESMMRTLTPSPIMLCAIEANLFLSPCAFWTSGVMPAAFSALVSSGASYCVYRVDDVVSGRITPTFPLVLPRSTALGSEAPLCGGLVRLHAALTPPLLEPLAPALGLLLLLEPHAVRLS